MRRNCQHQVAGQIEVLDRHPIAVDQPVTIGSMALAPSVCDLPIKCRAIHAGLAAGDDFVDFHEVTETLSRWTGVGHVVFMFKELLELQGIRAVLVVGVRMATYYPRIAA